MTNIETVTKVIAPDPLYDGECADRPFDWTILTSEQVTDVISPDFGGAKLADLPSDPFMQMGVEGTNVNEASVTAFIKQNYSLLKGVEALGVKQLEALRSGVRNSELYQSSVIAKTKYVGDLVDRSSEVRPLTEHYAIFVSSFLDQYLLEPITQRIKVLNAEECAAQGAIRMA